MRGIRGRRGLHLRKRGRGRDRDLGLFMPTSGEQNCAQQ
jgi:hypothetical protein